MKKTVFSIIVLLPTFAFSQRITGKINQNGDALSYVEVIAVKDKSKQTTISDEKGNYTLKLLENGNYNIKLVQDGAEISTVDVLVNGDIKQNFFIDKKQEQQIEGVTVTAKKRLIERKADRLIFNISNSIASQGMDGVEALSNTPQIKVDENTGISMVGKSGIAVMINERMLNLSGDELIKYLKSIRSENIERIEVITAPPAKYEAQGNSGLINIVLKKNQNLGWNGSLTTSLLQTTYFGFSNSASINYQNEKLRSSLKLRQYDSQKHSYENYKIVGADGLASSDDRRDFWNGAGINLSLDYELNKKSSIGLVYDYGFGDSGMDITNTSDYFQNGNYTNTLSTHAEHRNKNKQNTISAYYDIKFGKLNNKLSITGNYFSNTPKSNIDFTTVNNLGGSFVIKTPSELNYKIYSGQADLTLPYTFAKTEAGIKFTNFDNDSDIKYERLTDGNYITDPLRSNLFKYNEKNYAAYVSMEKQLTEKWSVKAGLRYEYSMINGNSVSSDQRTENSYGKFFPTAYLTYKANENNTFNLNYSKRINRPGFRAINPFRWYTNINSYYSGNPALSPSINHNFELSYLYKGKFSASAYFQRELDAFSQVVTLEGQDKTSNFYNFFNKNSTGISLSYSDTFFKFWEANYSADFSYMKTQVFATDAASRKGNSASFNIQNNFSLRKDKTIQFFMNYWFRLPSSLGNTYSYYVGNFTSGIKLNMMNKDLQMNIYVSDIFRQAKSHGEIYYQDSTHYFDNYYDGRNLTVSLTYNFGNKKVKGADRNVKFDEKNRAN
ncbi:TonB-dependent receptor domain-containing protein [Chryseobacterium polytrichastri]|uniref:Outer membrane receptor proteins, mostly Fe transport n=1 Tax=Chryseobacterium polytrichastri TaxID=1302687 RepID=A0A1M6YU63_9FLAO|nr:TonB-dependent receptor [Chryseobacterium polytrichastri]SHL21874.1 Outer membrane receptor proteins, mostly Fe transport [Chryseobacterium polytrichastri]